jgi:hypothetical protein
MSQYVTALFLLLPATAAAQGPNSLIGLTRGTPTLSERTLTCTPLPPCVISGLSSPATPWAGGTAWDPIHNVLWVSNGPQIEAVAPTTCTVYCLTQPAPLLSPNATVTGLEVVESQNQLWMVDSFGVLYQCTLACPPVRVATCNTPLTFTSNWSTGGLAVDECNGIVFYSYSNWSTNATLLAMAPIATPCQIFNQVPLPASCGMTAVTGLTVDGCRRVLYITDGTVTMSWNYTVGPGPTPVVTFGTLTCCALSLPTGSLVGLALRSGSANPAGTGCSNGSYPACIMSHVLRGSPNLGNASFGLDVNTAAHDTFIWCVIGVGPCVAGPVIPPLCGPAMVGPTLGTLGPFHAPTGTGCSIYAPFNLPIPLNRGLCGMPLSSQCVALCATGSPLGTAMSNCLSWQLQSN